MQAALKHVHRSDRLRILDLGTGSGAILLSLLSELPHATGLGVDISPQDSAEQAFRKVMPCARTVLARQIDRLLAGTATATPQDESAATYFGGRNPEDGRIDWTRSSTEIFNLIRAVTDPYPGAFSTYGGTKLMVWWAEPAPDRSGTPGEILSLDPLIIATGDGALQLNRVEWRGVPAHQPTLGSIF